jgi:hypothetical protein
VTWDFAVFEATGPARSAYACIPRDSLPGFVAALEEGALDDRIAAYLALTSRRRVLSAPEQATRLGLYDRMGAPAGLLAPERDPQTGHQEPGEAGAKRALARPGKRNGQEQKAPQEEQEAPEKEQQAPEKARRFLPRAAAIGFAAAVVLAGAGVATTVLSRGHSGPNGKPPAIVSFQPSALVFPAAPVNASITRSITLTNNGNSPATITRVSIGGPSRHDFSILTPAPPGAARGSGQAVHPAAQAPPCHRRVSPAQTCTITVAFTPLAPASRTADLHIDLASPLPPQDIALRGAGTTTPPPPSSAVSVTGVSPASGTTRGGTSVTITGTGFTAPPAVTGVSFGGAAAQFTIDSGTQITATSPPGTGTVHITVTTPAGTSAATAADQFGYRQTTTTPTTMALSSSANPSAEGHAVTFTATVRPASGSGTPTGTVTFSDGGSQIGTTKLDSSGTATITRSLGVGSHAITASYGGDRNFTASTGSLAQTVNQAATTTTTTITSSANPSAVGQAVTYTATVRPVPDGGTVAFSDGGTPISGCGAQQVDTSTGTATCQVTYTSTGAHSITAAYSGDPAFGASTGSLPQAVNVHGAGYPTARIISPPNSTYIGPGQSITLQGIGTEPGVGTLPGTGLRWSSSVDGNLGSGDRLTVQLSGPRQLCNPEFVSHIITLTVTDAGGRQATSNITVLVGRLC